MLSLQYYLKLKLCGRHPDDGLPVEGVGAIWPKQGPFLLTRLLSKGTPFLLFKSEASLRPLDTFSLFDTSLTCIVC